MEDQLNESLPNNGQIECPVNCPNRKTIATARDRGKWGAYAFAFLLTLLMGAYSFDSNWKPKEDPPIILWASLLPVIGACLGVQVDPETIGRILGR